ncbi:DMT family transporter [Cocleimonas flava]|uniref:Drug/metabolite transporter (DMT)-like permease n=1 Tax=Cocleimonas flava TaxID=634765 RepID=A0A4R1F1H2_9GAMM|nr:DMT family transporter [Cocleimonas flava]TCJ87733.1 drug/metabolite transporter (DMT)-like permease [Cocleimonas flava]
MDKNKLAVIYALLAVGMWSTVATAFKLGLQQMTLLQLLMGASFFSWLTLGSFLTWKGELKTAISTIPKNVKAILVLALLNPVLYYLVLFKAYDLLPAQVAQSLNYTWAITLTILSVPLLGHKLNKKDIIAILLGYVGVVFISISGKSISGELSYFGVFLALFSTIIWAGYWLLNARDTRPPVVKLFQSFTFAVPILIIITLIFEGLPQSVNAKQLMSVVYIGLFEMGLAFMCWQMALHLTDKVSSISTLIFLSPFVSLFIINQVLGEPLQWMTFMGLGLIIVGIMIQQSASKTKA